ncbi:MAG: EVE domain-containing protein, partial [Sphaerochaetaceae bacterium]
MIDKFYLETVLEKYKQDFATTQWADEKYKWEAVKCFQDNWEVNSVDFASMLTNSLAKTENLLASMNFLPSNMIKEFAVRAPEEVRAMFIALFDENEEVFERIEAFKTQSAILLEKYGEGAKQHYQNENAISTYLWLRYPDKYYIYKFGEVKTVSRELSSDYRFKKGAYADNIRNSILLYNEICNELHKDKELVDLLEKHLTPSFYPDPELKTLTIDVGFYISRYYSKKDLISDDSWIPVDYSPEISTEKWIELLNDKEIFTPSSLEIMKRFKDYGGMATCTQLETKYGENKNFYNSGSVSLARRIAEKTGCPRRKDDHENSRWWPILYVGRQASKDDQGSFVWKLRDELATALDKVDLSNVALYATPADGKDIHGYWWLNANPKIWSFSDIAVGEEQSYTLYNDNGNKRRIFQNFLDAKAGDLIIGYESNPIKKIVALGKVVAEQDGEKIYFEKVEGLSVPIDYQTLKECPELERMEYFRNAQGSLFKLTNGEFEFIMDLIREENPVAAKDHVEAYGRDDFLKEVYMSENKYDMLVAVLKNKQNIILQGPPGVGKTFAAKRLAYSMIGVKDDNRI